MFILPLLLFAPVTLGNHTMVPADNLFQWAPWTAAASDFDFSFPHNSLLSDLVLENFAWKNFITSSLREGELPLWNPYIFAGTPFLATGQHSAYYPFSSLFLFLPIVKAYGWFTLIQLWLAGVFTYVFARVLGMRRSSSAISGLIFQGSGFLLVSSAVFPMILGAAIWLPLLLACTEKIIHNATRQTGAGKTLPWAALGSIALGMQLLAGHIEITYYTLLVIGFFAIWRLASYAFVLFRKEKSRPNQQSNEEAGPDVAWYKVLIKPIVWLGAFILVGLMLGAVQFIPFIEVGQANFREGSATLAEIRGWAYPVRRLITLLMPNFFGNPADHQYFDIFTRQQVPVTVNAIGAINPHGAYSTDWGIKNYVEGGIYLGVFSLILLVLGLWSAVKQRIDRRSEIGFFFVLSLLSLSFIFGTALYAILYYGLPGINQLHSPFRWVYPLSISVAILAGYGIDYVLATQTFEQKDYQLQRDSSSVLATLRQFLILRAKPSSVAYIGGLAFWAGLALLIGLLLSYLFYNSLEPTIERIFLGLERAADAFPNTAAFFSFEFQQIAILGAMLLVSGLVLRASQTQSLAGKRPYWVILAALVIGLDLLIAGYGFNSASDSEILEYQPELIDWLEEQPGLWRLTTFTPHGDKPLNANLPWLSQLQDVRGYDSIILKQYTNYMEAIEPQNELQFNRIQPIVNWESLNSPLLDLLGTKYIISSEDIELPKLNIAWQGEGLLVYENLAAVPRAYTIAQSATVVSNDVYEAMQSYDPRQYVVVNQDDWPQEQAGSRLAGNLEAADIRNYGNIEVIVRAAPAEAAWLVLNDTFFQGWDAYVRPVTGDDVAGDETKVDIVQVNGNFRGVRLEPGSWEVRFRYSPLSFKLGGLTSFMGIIIILFAMAVWSWRRIYNPTTPLTNTRSIAKNSLAPMTLNLFNRAIDFVFAAFYLRILGPGDAGKYATAIIIAGWFEIVANWGLNTLIIREVSKDRNQASRYLLNTSILRMGTAVIASLPIAVYLITVNATGNPLDPATTTAILLLMVGMIFSGLGQGLAGLFYAYEVAEFPAAVTTITTILKVGFGVAVLLAGFSFVGLAGISILVNFITLLILTIAAIRQFDLSGPWRVEFSLQRRMIFLSYPLMLNHLFAVIFFQIDIPLMKQINGSEAVGWYNSAYKWVNAFNVIPSFFTFALFPVISRQVQSADSDARRTFRLSIKLMLLIAFPIAALTTLMAPLMIGVLGGREFLPHGAIALQLVIWSIPFGWMNSVTNYVLIAYGLEKKLTGAFIIGVSFNLVANLILLPYFSYVAASVITIFSELLLLFLFARYLRPALPEMHWLRLIKKPLAIAAGMMIAIALGSQVNIFLAFILGLAAYPLSLWLLRVFGAEEKQILDKLLPSHITRWLTISRPGGATK
jgi:O-antigen/teichoic acid export membrane protein